LRGWRRGTDEHESYAYTKVFESSSCNVGFTSIIKFWAQKENVGFHHIPPLLSPHWTVPKGESYFFLLFISFR
jgi:hypothetical protein